MGCDSKNEKSIKKLNKIKNRSGPISIIAPNRTTAIDWMFVKKNHKAAIKNKLKNGNTVIAPIKNNICSYLIAGDKNTVGIRVPDHLFCNKFPHPITSTSVNRTGEKPLTKPDDISNEFISDIDLIIDDGIINGVGSKIFLFENGSWEQLR